MKSSRKENAVVVVLAVLIVFALFYGIYYLNAAGVGVVDGVHEHADFAVFVHGMRYNFSQEKFMSDEGALSPFVHLHDMDGDVLHKHASGVTLGYFFESVGMSLNATCLALDAKTYCADGSNTLRMYVNGLENTLNERYKFKDLDQILITYGQEEIIIQEQVSSVTDKACIYSGKCPERGSPPDEIACIAGVGCVP